MGIGKPVKPKKKNIRADNMVVHMRNIEPIPNIRLNFLNKYNSSELNLFDSMVFQFNLIERLIDIPK